MNESKYDMHESITHKRTSPSHMLPLSLTYSLPLPLWRQAPKPKGQLVGREQTSQALRYGERSQTEPHHYLTLNSERLDPLERAHTDPQSLEV